MTNSEYDALAKAAAPNSKSWKNIPFAFLIGGIICTIGEFLSNFYQSMGMDLELASTTVSITLIFLSALLTGLKVYDNIAKRGGAGTLVPITGFANAIASPALEFKSEGLILGLGTRMFAVAGPVIVYGITASILYGLIIYLFKLY